MVLTYNSRVNEFAADAFGVKLGMGEALASGLIKISIGAVLSLPHARPHTDMHTHRRAAILDTL